MLMNVDTKYPEATTVEFTKRVSTKSGGSKSITVEKCENGFIISICDDTKDENGNYSYSHKKYISSTNPLKKENSVMNLKEFLKESL
jgi:hypothetical protein